MKLRIGFEITDNWNIQGFRDFIRSLQTDPSVYNKNLTEVELFLISNDDSSAYINTVGRNIGLDSSHIIITNFSNDKVQTIEDNNIDIYFDNLQSIVVLLEPTETYGILVNSLPNVYYMSFKWLVTFINTLTIILGNEETSC